MEDGTIVEAEVLVFKKDTLHNSSKIKIRKNGERAKLKLRDLDSIKVVNTMFVKFKDSYGDDILGKLIINGSYKVYEKHWVNDHGYTFVDNKANYMEYDYYFNNGKKIEKISFFSRNRGKAILKKLNKLLPDCSYLTALNAEEITYDSIPNIIDKYNEECN